LTLPPASDILINLEGGSGMKRKTILAVAEYHERQLQDAGYIPKRSPRSYNGRSQKIWGNHALFMVRRIRLMLFTKHRDKAMRWLSCVQGIIMAQGITSINSSKILLKPKQQKQKVRK
jgi:hypothetical protein